MLNWVHMCAPVISVIQEEISNGELHEILDLVESRSFSQLRNELVDMNPADIAEEMALIEEDKALIVVFRLLPKEQAAEVFSYLEPEDQQRIVEGISDKELASIVNDMFVDDAAYRIDGFEKAPTTVSLFIC